jgi:hypothetical protein
MALRAALRYFAPRTGGVSNTLRAASTAAAAAPAPPAAEPEALPSMDEMRTKARRVYKEVCPLRGLDEADNSTTASAVTSESPAVCCPLGGGPTTPPCSIAKHARTQHYVTQLRARLTPAPTPSTTLTCVSAARSRVRLSWTVSRQLTAENAKITDPAKLKQQLDLAEHIKKGEWAWAPCLGRGGEALRCCACGTAVLLYAHRTSCCGTVCARRSRWPMPCAEVFACVGCGVKWGWRVGLHLASGGAPTAGVVCLDPLASLLRVLIQPTPVRRVVSSCPGTLATPSVSAAACAAGVLSRRSSAMRAG